jgi:hypothetical protein
MGIFKKIGLEDDTDLLTRPSMDLEEDDGGHDRFSHYKSFVWKEVDTK